MSDAIAISRMNGGQVVCSPVSRVPRQYNGEEAYYRGHQVRRSEAEFDNTQLVLAITPVTGSRPIRLRAKAAEANNTLDRGGRTWRKLARGLEQSFTTPSVKGNVTNGGSR